MKDPTEWRKKVAAWKNGTPTSELFNLPKYDGGTDDKTYLPEYEYEATVTPQGTSLEKHKRITNEEDWQKYLGNVGAGYINKAQESVAKPILEGLKTASYFTPLGPVTSFADLLAAKMNGQSDEDVMMAAAGMLPGVRWANGVGRVARGVNAIHNLSPEELRAISRNRVASALESRFPGISSADDVVNDLDIFATNFPNEVEPAIKDLLSGTDDAVGFLEKMHMLKRGKNGRPVWHPGYAGQRFNPTHGDFAHAYYRNMTPQQASYQGMLDISNVPINGRILMDHLSTDSYPMIANAFQKDASQSPLWYKFKKYAQEIQGKPYGELTEFERPFRHIDVANFTPPTFELAPVDEYIRLNREGKLGKLDQIKAVERLNKHIDRLQQSVGKDIPEAYIDDNGYDIIAPFLHGTRVHDKGKSIHINPANKGKFNATKKRTGKTTEQLAHSKNPLTRKRAIFALNSRKWSK